MNFLNEIKYKKREIEKKEERRENRSLSLSSFSHDISLSRDEKFSVIWRKLLLSPFLSRPCAPLFLSLLRSPLFPSLSYFPSSFSLFLPNSFSLFRGQSLFLSQTLSPVISCFSFSFLFFLSL